MRSWFVILILLTVTLFAWLFQFMWQPTSATDGVVSTSLMEQNGARLDALKQRVREQDIVEQRPITRHNDQTDNVLDWLAEGNVDRALDYHLAHIAEASSSYSVALNIASELIKLGRYNEAVSLLYEQRLFIPFDREEAFLDAVYKRVDKIEQALVESEQKEALIPLYQNLVNLHADHTPYYLKLAQWQLEAGQYGDVEQSLVGARVDFNYLEQVAELEAALQDALNGNADDRIAVPLIKNGDQYAVELVLAGEVTATVMIDTGASMTVIRDALAEQLSPANYEILGGLALNTANGVVEGQKLLVSDLVLGNLTLDQVEIATIPLDSLKYDGLLGMNILSRFEFFIDQAQSVLYLR